MRTIALLPHTGKPKAVDLARSLVPRLLDAGVVVCTSFEAAAVLPLPHVRCDVEALHSADAAIVLVGDGALLIVSRLLYGLDIPILAVNLGRMGFLAAIEPDELDEAVQRLLIGDFAVEERMMVEACVWRGGKCHSTHRGLNDIVIARGTFARMISLEASVGKSTLGRFVGDGLIVATPTGSTAYSLSAGGPVVHPAVDGMVVTPICPHSLGARAVVVRGEDEIRVRAETLGHDDELLLSVDGQAGTRLMVGDDILVRRAEAVTKLIHFNGRTFYDVLGIHLRNPHVWRDEREDTAPRGYPQDHC
jgi:NAD+ kinase